MTESPRRETLLPVGPEAATTVPKNLDTTADIKERDKKVAEMRTRIDADLATTMTALNNPETKSEGITQVQKLTKQINELAMLETKWKNETEVAGAKLDTAQSAVIPETRTELTSLHQSVLAKPNSDSIMFKKPEAPASTLFMDPSTPDLEQMVLADNAAIIANRKNTQKPEDQKLGAPMPIVETASTAPETAQRSLNASEKIFKKFIDSNLTAIEGSIAKIPDSQKKEQMLGYIKNPTKENTISLQKEIYSGNQSVNIDGKFGASTLSALNKWVGETVSAAAKATAPTRTEAAAGL